MDKLRDFLQSWPGRILMMLCLSPVVLMGFESLFQGGQLAPNEIAKVGDTGIATEMVQNEANNTRSRLTSQGIDGALIDNKALNLQAFENLMSSTLLSVQAQTLGMQTSDEMISRLLQQDPQFADANGKFSNDLFARFLTANRMTKDVLFANYRDQLNLRQLSGSVMSASVFPQSQISRLIDLQTESRPVWVKRFAWQEYASKVTISDADINQYYTANKDKLNTPNLVDLVYLQVDGSSVPVETVSEDDLKAAYDNYLKTNNLGKKVLAQILFAGDKASERAMQVASELKAGKNFEELAKTHSDDPSGKTGGKMGSFNPAVFGADAGKVEQAISNLSVGETSEPIQTAFGWQIFKVLEVGSVPTLNELTDELTKTVQTQKQNASLSDLLANINSMSADGYALADIAKELKLTAHTLTNFSQANNQTILNQPIIISTAFDEELLAGQSVSGSIALDGKTFWVQPTNHRKPAPMSLEQAMPMIKAELTRQKASELAMADAQKLVQNFDKTKVGEFVALGLTNRQSPMLQAQEKLELFAKPATKDELVAWAVLTDTGASVLVGGDISTQATAQMGDAERKMAGNMMREIAGQDLLEDYLLYLKNTINIQTNEEVLKSL